MQEHSLPIGKREDGGREKVFFFAFGALNGAQHTTLPYQHPLRIFPGSMCVRVCAHQQFYVSIHADLEGESANMLFF